MPGSSSAILDTDLGTRSAQVPRPAVAERKPLVLPQLLFPRHPARPNVLARLPPLAQGSGHASTPRLLDQGPHRTAKLAVSRPCGWRTQIPCDWLGLLKPPADLLSRQLLCARLPPAHSTPLNNRRRGHDTGCKCRLSVQKYPKGNPKAEYSELVKPLLLPQKWETFFRGIVREGSSV